MLFSCSSFSSGLRRYSLIIQSIRARLSGPCPRAVMIAQIRAGIRNISLRLSRLGEKAFFPRAFSISSLS